MSAVTINVVAERRDGSFCLYLVEEGPWPEDHSERLRALQKRLFDAVEAVAEGKLAERFPGTKGKACASGWTATICLWDRLMPSSQRFRTFSNPHLTGLPLAAPWPLRSHTAA
jgi:hypothetical protein